MNTLSIQHPRPSIEMRTLASCTTRVNRGEVNWPALIRIEDLRLGYLERSQDVLVHHTARRRGGRLIPTAFVENAVNEIVAKRMNKKRQMRWNRTAVQSFPDIRGAVLNYTLKAAFRHRIHILVC